MIDRRTANEWTLDRYDKMWLAASIHACIYEAIANQKFHCDWYSPAMYDAKDDIDFISGCYSALEELNYKVTPTIFNPNDKFPLTRVKLHINWE